MAIARAAVALAALASLTTLTLEVPRAGARSPDAQRSIAIVRATAVGRLVLLRVRVRGWAPGGRWNVYLDGRYRNFSTNARLGLVRVTRPGRHTVYGALAGRNGRLLRPLARSRRVVVRVARPGGPVIAAAGDIACDPADSAFNGGRGREDACRQSATAALLARARLAAVLPLGDLQYECGARAAFARSYEPTWGRAKGISHPAIGNHEYQTWGGPNCGAPGAPGYFAYFASAAGERSKGYYSFDLGAWHLIALNSNCKEARGCGAGSAQERWLRADLRASTRRCTLAYTHHPRFSSGKEHGSDAVLAPLWQALYESGAEVVLSGHEHNYERFAPQTAAGAPDRARGLRAFVVGTGGRNHTGFRVVIANSKRRNDATFGVLELTLRRSGYSWQFIPEAGKLFTDSGSGTCH